jgi:hypothetical protein
MTGINRHSVSTSREGYIQIAQANRRASLGIERGKRAFSRYRTF